MITLLLYITEVNLEIGAQVFSYAPNAPNLIAYLSYKNLMLGG